MSNYIDTKLNTPVIANIPVTPTGDMVTKYEIFLNNKLIFTGKTFISSTDTIIHIPISDILRDYIYSGEGLIKPYWDGSQFTYPHKANIEPVEYVANIEVVVDGETRTSYKKSVLLQYSDPIKQYVKPNLIDQFPSDDYIGTDLVLNHLTSALPHVPGLNTNNYYVGALVLQNKSKDELKSIMIGAQAINLLSRTYPAPSVDRHGGFYPIAVGLKSVSDMQNKNMIYYNNNTSYPIAEVDHCIKDYYVCWLVDGCWFSYGFSGRAKIVRNTEHTRIVDIYEQTNNAVSVTQKTYNLNSGLVDKEYYYPFQCLYTSRYVGLFDTRENEFRFVNVDDTNIEYKSNGNELKNFSVTLSDRAKIIN